MTPTSAARLKFFLAIFAAIVALHAIVIALVVSSSGGTPPPEPGTPPAAPPGGKDPAPGTVVPAGDPKKPGGTPPAAVPRQARSRYRHPSSSPVFGKDFNHIYARRGEFPARLVPGDKMHKKRQQNCHRFVTIAL